MDGGDELIPGVPRALWGKGKTESFHPLLFHMLDVGWVARLMMEHFSSDRFVKMVLGSVTPTQLGLLVALHDLGKASPAFQLKRKDLIEHWRSGFTWPTAEVEAANSTEVSHGRVGAAVLRTVLSERYGLARPAAALLADSLAGHHGRFAEFEQVESVGKGRLGTWSGLGSGQERWAQLRSCLVEVLEGCFDGVRASCPPQFPPTSALVLAGLVSVADWIGSNEEWFPYCPQDDLPTYHTEAVDKARFALAELGFARWEPREGEFRNRFGFEPFPVQQRVAELGRNIAESAEPAIVVVEAEMGSGKTEAAFDLVAELVGAGLAAGAYIALPTRATANQMFQRVVSFLRECSASPEAVVQLAHGLARLDADFDELLGIPPAPPVTPSEVYDDTSAKVRADEWFTSTKRSLLAPWGVGTVDAALIAALRVKHGPVRIFGLADKVVVIDEVHAYDLYMSTLLDRLLEWFGSLGVSVVLLSATLPATRRQELLSAWSAREIEVPGGYPLVSWATRSGEGSQTADPARRAEVRLECRLGSSDPSVVAELLIDAVESGGCVAMVCNTVGRAQEMYQAVAEQADDDTELLLLHARIPFDDRLAREKQITGKFGRTGDRPERAI